MLASMCPFWCEAEANYVDAAQNRWGHARVYTRPRVVLAFRTTAALLAGSFAAVLASMFWMRSGELR